MILFLLQGQKLEHRVEFRRRVLYHCIYYMCGSRRTAVRRRVTNACVTPRRWKFISLPTTNFPDLRSSFDFNVLTHGDSKSYFCSEGMPLVMCISKSRDTIASVTEMANKLPKAISNDAIVRSKVHYSAKEKERVLQNFAHLSIPYGVRYQLLRRTLDPMLDFSGVLND